VLAEVGVHPVVDDVLGDEDAVVREADGELVAALGVCGGLEADANAVDGLFARVDGSVDARQADGLYVGVTGQGVGTRDCTPRPR